MPGVRLFNATTGSGVSTAIVWQGGAGMFATSGTFGPAVVELQASADGNNFNTIETISQPRVGRFELPDGWTVRGNLANTYIGITTSITLWVDRVVA